MKARTEDTAAPIIELKQVSKRFGANTDAARNLSLRLMRGQLLSLLGPSGCGKTTALRLIAGLEAPDAGEIWLNDACVAGNGKWVPPEARHLGMVFQDYALFPHLTLAQNIAFPIHKQPAQPRQARVDELLHLVGLVGLGQRYPHQISGGQQQRVALARALAAHPAVVLLDEPFSNLDAALRKSMREEMRDSLRRAGATAIFVTHDQEEALSLSDVVAVMDAGAVVQMGTPQQIYLRPVNRAIAEFVGEANFLQVCAEGQVAQSPLGLLLLLAPAKGCVEAMIRPEALVLKPDANAAGRIESLTFYGHDQVARVRMGDESVLYARMSPRPDLVVGSAVSVSVQGPVVAYPDSGR